MLYTPVMPDEQKAFLYRMPLPLYQELAEWAAEDRRSVTAQISHLLEQLVEERRAKRPKRRG